MVTQAETEVMTSKNIVLHIDNGWALCDLL